MVIVRLFAASCFASMALVAGSSQAAEQRWTCMYREPVDFGPRAFMVDVVAKRARLASPNLGEGVVAARPVSGPSERKDRDKNAIRLYFDVLEDGKKTRGEEHVFLPATRKVMSSYSLFDEQGRYLRGGPPPVEVPCQVGTAALMQTGQGGLGGQGRAAW